MSIRCGNCGVEFTDRHECLPLPGTTAGRVRLWWERNLSECRHCDHIIATLDVGGERLVVYRCCWCGRQREGWQRVRPHGGFAPQEVAGGPVTTPPAKAAQPTRVRVGRMS